MMNLNINNEERNIMKFNSWDCMNYKFLELTKNLETLSFFEVNEFETYLCSDKNVYIIERDFDKNNDEYYTLTILSISDFFENRNIEMNNIISQCDTKMAKYNALLKERDFLFNKMNEVMPVYNNASVIAEENEKLRKENLELKGTISFLSKLTSCSEKVIGELKYEIELLKAGIPYNKED